MTRNITAYHGGPVAIKRFSPKYGAQGVMWFTTDRAAIVGGTSGAVSSKWIMTVTLRVDRTAGWDLYDKLFLEEIRSRGYDSINLDDNWVIFDAKRVKVVRAERAGVVVGDDVRELLK